MPRRRSPRPHLVPTALAAVLAACGAGEPGTGDGAPAPAVYAADDWPVYGGDPGGLKYSSLADIDRSNVAGLEPAWTWETGEEPIPDAASPIQGERVAPGAFEATPIVINDTMWLSTPYNRVVALDAETGEEFWSYDPRAWEWGNLHRGCRFCHRGIAQWSDGRERRIFLNTRWRLIALDAASGEPIPSFGNGGEADLTEGSRGMRTGSTSPIRLRPWCSRTSSSWAAASPTTGSTATTRPATSRRSTRAAGTCFGPSTRSPRRRVRGRDVGGRVVVLHRVRQRVGAFSLDAERGLIYLPVSTPNNDFYGGHRRGQNLFAESLVCLDARTGERVWHFQTVHHGLWDYDLPAPPGLVTIEVDGRRIDAVVAVTKTAFTYVLDRVTGEPVWPVEERAVPESTVPGEVPWPTQPFPTRPAPFSRQGITEDDLIDFTPELRAEALEVFRRHRTGPIFTPPSVEGTIMMPGLIGGAGWGGAAIDPHSGHMFVKAYDDPFLARVAEAEPGAGDADYLPNFASTLSVAGGLPIVKPPYGTLTAIDLNAGDHLWQRAFGGRLGDPRAPRAGGARPASRWEGRRRATGRRRGRWPRRAASCSWPAGRRGWRRWTRATAARCGGAIWPADSGAATR